MSKMLIVVLIIFSVAAGMLPAQEPDSLKQAFYNQHFLKDYQAAFSNYEQFFKEVSGSIEKTDQAHLCKALENFRDLLAETGKTDEFAASLKKFGIPETFYDKYLVKGTGEVFSPGKSDSKETFITMDMQNVSAATVLNVIARTAHLNLIFCPDNIKKMKIDMRVKNLPAREALEMVANMTSSVLVKTEKGYMLEERRHDEIKKECSFLIRNDQKGAFQELMNKLSSECTGLDISESAQKGYSKAVLLATPAAESKFRDLLYSGQAEKSSITANFKIYLLAGDTRKLLSSPKIIMSEGRDAEIKLDGLIAQSGGKKINQNLNLGINVIREEGNFLVKLFITSSYSEQKTISKKLKKTEDFRTEKNFESVIMDLEDGRKLLMEMELVSSN
ncbi:MAG: hypothetical protein PHW04_11095 [Candidatus Wallbacteria bacterium]|nr:hypothetical protein [Candidatus Wallbacteria bacterium]